MELVAGSSLEQELSRGRRFDPREVVRIAVEVCKALRHAHDRGIIHRDIKPGNLLVGANGQVKIADFGIARFFGNSKLTVAGSIIGTAEYMAPEQAAGKPVEPRSDLYSLGAVMYVLLACRPLFKAKSLREMLHKQQYEIPEPLRHFNQSVPEPLERLIARLLEKEPSRRIPNAMVLARHLEAMQQGTSEPTETVEADASDFLLSPTIAKSVEQPAIAEGEKSPSDDCAATSEFTPPPDVPAAYVEPSSDPLAPTIAASNYPVLAVESEVKEPAKPASRFVPVSEEELGRIDIEEPNPALTFLGISLGTWSLIAALLMVAGGMWYFLQPPSADGLYRRIMNHVDDESTDSIRAAEDDVQLFLNLFSDDPRAAKIRGYQHEIEFDRQEKELRWKKNPLPVERAYLDAFGYLQTDPDKSAAKFQAVIDLYDAKSNQSLPGGYCIELARRRIKDIEKEREAHAEEQLPQLQSRLDRADETKADDPKHAEAMYRAVLELYADKSWAAPAIERAKAALKEPEKGEKSDP
jgi:serine/threonine-protein kinase